MPTRSRQPKKLLRVGPPDFYAARFGDADVIEPPRALRYIFERLVDAEENPVRAKSRFL